jgi:hypothetical protein
MVWGLGFGVWGLGSPVGKPWSAWCEMERAEVSGSSVARKVSVTFVDTGTVQVGVEEEEEEEGIDWALAGEEAERSLRKGLVQRMTIMLTQAGVDTSLPCSSVDAPSSTAEKQTPTTPRRCLPWVGVGGWGVGL